MQTIQLGKRYLQVPTTLEELTRNQLIRYVELANSNLTVTQFNVLMLLNILDVQKRYWLKWFFFRNEYLIPLLDKITFGKLNWTVTVIDQEDFYHISLLSEKFHKVKKFVLQNPVPKYRWLSGPDTLLSNITFRQFRKAEELNMKYLLSKSESDLDNLLGWLYIETFLPKSVTLSPKMAQKRAKVLKNWSLANKLTAYNFYATSRQNIAKIYKALFSKGTEKSSTPSPSAIKNNFEKAVRGLSGNINNDESTDFQPCLDALAHLNDRAEEAEALKKIANGTANN